MKVCSFRAKDFMQHSYKFWQKLFLFCLGLFLASAFCMKWIEPGFVYNGKTFTMIGLEVSYSQSEVINIFSSIDNHVKSLVTFHLTFDFVFMAGVYPGIAALCMMGRLKASGRRMKSLLFAMALLQGAAWLCDIAENSFLLHWVKSPAATGSFAVYHLIVWTKWILALSSVFLAVTQALRRNKQLLKT